MEMESNDYKRFNIFEEYCRVQKTISDLDAANVNRLTRRYKDLRERHVLTKAIIHLHDAKKSYPFFAQKLQEKHDGRTPDFKAFAQNLDLWGHIEITDATPPGYISPKWKPPNEITRNKPNIIQLRDMPSTEIPRFLKPLRDRIIEKAKHDYPEDTTLIVYIRRTTKDDEIYHYFIEENFDEIVLNENRRLPFEGLNHFRKILVLSPSFKKVCLLK